MNEELWFLHQPVLGQLTRVAFENTCCNAISSTNLSGHNSGMGVVLLSVCTIRAMPHLLFFFLTIILALNLLGEVANHS